MRVSNRESKIDNFSMSVRTEQMAVRAGVKERDEVAAAAVRSERLRAPFSLRCGAMLIDYTLVISVLAFATLLARLFGGGGRWTGATVLSFGYLAAAAVAVLNFIVLASLAGRTTGKWVTGLRIERRDGRPLSVGRAVLRHLVGYPLSVAPFGLGFLLAAFNLDGRALHDMIAGTIVVRERKSSRAGEPKSAV